MGKKTTILLVNLFFFFLLPITPLYLNNCLAKTVKASNYDQYWVWAGLKYRPEIVNAKVIYLHQGEVFEDATGEAKLIPQGGTQPAPHKPEIWIAYRVRTINWNLNIFHSVKKRYEYWSSFPGKVLGIQIDFDASTKNLDKYAFFLQQLRTQLPADCLISVTGLMDWAAYASPESLNLLSTNVDELIFQTYQGKNTVARIDSYLTRLNHINIPFRLGLAEGSDWSAPTTLINNPNLKGYVVFLRNSR